jgi:para-nitrobenzyl esterase
MLTGLRWVRSEIGAFGGIGTRITIMGHSSGAQAVSLLTMMPAADTLFEQAIALSGKVD